MKEQRTGRRQTIVSKKNPKNSTLQRLWLIEAKKYNVLPIDDRGAERFNSNLAGRPQLIRGNAQRFFPSMVRLTENSVINIKNKSFSVTADGEFPKSDAEGVIIAQGGRFGGWGLYARDGKLKFVLQFRRVSRNSPQRQIGRYLVGSTR